MSHEYGSTITTDLGFDETVERARDALAEQGFGVLTEVDVQARLKNERLKAALEAVTGWPEAAHQAT